MQAQLECGFTPREGKTPRKLRLHGAPSGFVADEKGFDLQTGSVLARWQQLPPSEAAAEILSCCGSTAWAAQMAAHRPYDDETCLFATADACWRALPEADWLEAFRSHPRIGEKHAQTKTTAASAAWSRGEQSQMSEADAAILQRMQQGHRQYEERFGRIFIVCASGKKPAELLRILESRLLNDPAAELLESASQQQQIMQLRLRKWLAETAAV